jgi:hypothetical protein
MHIPAPNPNLLASESIPTEADAIHDDTVNTLSTPPFELQLILICR